ncbi:hypothetical protein, variant 1 [Aphanomyces invadans]|nr:hypothetical protein, variant 1 [Aphanomyces invadans]ETV91214.1 hypothetical protein, variant 1 [Aphanomyces invadans]|eukprot:XP_008880051.1 hypothetical protein, variant 1 [Aphanomyces invadans]
MGVMSTLDSIVDLRWGREGATASAYVRSCIMPIDQQDRAKHVVSNVGLSPDVVRKNSKDSELKALGSGMPWSMNTRSMLWSIRLVIHSFPSARDRGCDGRCASLHVGMWPFKGFYMHNC